jgi:hypothetical protein
MSTALDLLSECSAAGVELHLDNGRLRYRARAGAYTEALRQKVAAHKAALIALLCLFPHPPHLLPHLPLEEPPCQAPPSSTPDAAL